MFRFRGADGCLGCSPEPPDGQVRPDTMHSTAKPSRILVADSDSVVRALFPLAEIGAAVDARDRNALLGVLETLHFPVQQRYYPVFDYSRPFW